MVLGIGLVAMGGSETEIVNTFVGPRASARILRAIIPIIIVALLGDDIIDVYLSHFAFYNPALINSIIAPILILITVIVIIRISKIVFFRADKAEAPAFSIGRPTTALWMASSGGAKTRIGSGNRYSATATMHFMGVDTPPLRILGAVGSLSRGRRRRRIPSLRRSVWRLRGDGSLMPRRTAVLNCHRRAAELIACDNCKIGTYAKGVADRNPTAHPNGDIVFSTPAALNIKIA